MDLKAKCADYERAPSTELRGQLLEELLTRHMRATEIGRLAGEGNRQYLASEKRRVVKALEDMVLIGDTLTQSPTTRLADACARLAAVG